MTLSKELDDKIRNPDFAFVDAHLGPPVPDALKELYTSGRVFELEEIIVDEEELYIAVAYFLPLIGEYYRRSWPGVEKTLNFAQDGMGNMYVASPEEDYSVVYFYDHETGEFESLNINIPEFIQKLEEWKGVERY